MNGFIGALAAQLALKPVSPAADGIASRPRRPVAECLRAQRTARAKLTAPSRRSAYLQQLRRVWWADGAAVCMRVRVAAARSRPSRSRARAVTTLRRVASQQPMAPAPQVGRTSMRRRTQRTARANAPPVLQVGSAHRCPSRAPPSRLRAPMPRLFHRGGAHRRSWAPPHPAAGHRRIPRMGSGEVRWERACCPLRSRRVALLAICCRGASSGGRAWRHMPANCIPRRPAHSNVCSQCALGRSATARCPRNAFPSAWRWRYVDVMRSRVSDDGNILPRCIPKKASDGKRAPSWQYIAAVYSK